MVRISQQSFDLGVGVAENIQRQNQATLWLSIHII